MRDNATNCLIYASSRHCSVVIRVVQLYSRHRLNNNKRTQYFTRIVRSRTNHSRCYNTRGHKVAIRVFSSWQRP